MARSDQRPADALAIGDFRIRGCYPTQRSLISSAEAHQRRGGGRPAALPGHAPARVDFETAQGAAGSIEVPDLDLVALCQPDVGAAAAHLALILAARRRDPSAQEKLAAATARSREVLIALCDRAAAAESRFLVPSASNTPHEPHAVSHKGSVLLMLTRQGYPVPDFAILTAQAYLDGVGHLDQHLAEAAGCLATITGQALGGREQPLVLALRCAMPYYAPGVMPTYLNVGVSEGVAAALERAYGRNAALRMFLNNLKNLCLALDHRDAAVLADTVTRELSDQELERLVDQAAEVVRRREPRLVEDPCYQLEFLARHAYQHFEENQDLLLTLSRGSMGHPSLIVQRMVCTVGDSDAYAGVLFSRHPKTGEGRCLQTARNIFGEEIMTGTVVPEETTFALPTSIEETFPAVSHFAPHLDPLERALQTPVTIEFVVEASARQQLFALLQLNQTGMTGRGAMVSVVDMHQAGIISRRQVTELILPYHIKQLESDTIDPETFTILERFCTGVSVLPRAAVSARIFFSAEAALRAKKQGDKVCFCKRTFAPTDTPVMREVDAIVGLTSAAIHVVTICQSFGVPAFLSLERDGVTLHPEGRLQSATGCAIEEGEWITISSRRQALYRGRAKFKPARLMRFMRGEPVRFEPDEVEAYRSMAYAYRYYQQLVRAQKFDKIATLSEVIRLVNLELRGEADEAMSLVRGWYDGHETQYLDEVFKSDMGDHLNQSTVFELLTLERKVAFFRRALSKCQQERLSGYRAGAFMLGRFLCLGTPVAFWQAFTPAQHGLLVNEWLLFEKYMQILHEVGERKLVRARKKLLDDGLDPVSLSAHSVKSLIPLKLSGVDLGQVQAELPEWVDPQTNKVLEILKSPFQDFYDFGSRYSLRELEALCRREELPVPGPDDR